MRTSTAITIAFGVVARPACALSPTMASMSDGLGWLRATGRQWSTVLDSGPWPLPVRSAARTVGCVEE